VARIVGQRAAYLRDGRVVAGARAGGDLSGELGGRLGGGGGGCERWQGGEEEEGGG